MIMPLAPQCKVHLSITCAFLHLRGCTLGVGDNLGRYDSFGLHIVCHITITARLRPAIEGTLGDRPNKVAVRGRLSV